MLVSTSYRWSWRTAPKILNHWVWDIRNGVKNLFTFFDAVWWFRSWDWNGMVELLRVSAEEMRQSQATGIHVGSEREAKRLLILRTLCERLLADDYFHLAGYDPKTWGSLPDHRRSHIAKHSTYMSDQDAVYLGQMLRFVQHWWE